MILIYFDKNLKSSEENLSNFIKVRKAFYGDEIYGVDTLDKLKVLISLYHKTGEYYYIISSGSGAEELLKSEYYDSKRIMDFIIYCFNKEKYMHYLGGKISMIENINFDNVINHLKSKQPISNEKDILKHCSSFILEDEYNGTPLKVHRKMSEYFDENYNIPAFDQNIKNKILDLLNKIAQTKYDYENAKNIIETINDEVNLIKCYTAESIIVYFLNKCLREIDDKCIEFAGLLNYALYKYYFDHPEINITQDVTFYRKLVISIKDLYAYDLFEGKIICFPSFTSTSIDPDAFGFPVVKTHKLTSYSKNFPSDQEKTVSRDKCVLLKFNYKYNESNVCPAFDINSLSYFENEKEFLFPPFSFFRISKFNSAEGTRVDPVIIELEVIPKKEILEKHLKKGGTIIYDEYENCMKYSGDNEENNNNNIYQFNINNFNEINNLFNAY